VHTETGDNGGKPMERSKYLKPIIKAVITIIVLHCLLTYLDNTISVIVANKIAVESLNPSDFWFMVEQAYNQFIRPMFNILKPIVYIWNGAKIVLVLKDYICNKGE
jgi:hypothetical protein